MSPVWLSPFPCTDIARFTLDRQAENRHVGNIFGNKRTITTMATDHITTDAVRKLMHLHPGIRAYEIAEMLKISPKTAEKCVRELRAEWKGASE